MSLQSDLGRAMTSWADQTPSVSALVLIGSRERSVDDRIWRADAQSDWDFQIITSQPEMFANRSWISDLADVHLRARTLHESLLSAVSEGERSLC